MSPGSARHFTSQPACLAASSKTPSSLPKKSRAATKTIDPEAQRSSSQLAFPRGTGSRVATSSTLPREGQRVSRSSSSSNKRSERDGSRQRSFSRSGSSFGNNAITKDPGSRGGIDGVNGGSRPRSVPSAKSGGVPEPSPAYLEQAHCGSQRLDTAQPLLIVVDLNGTLLFRPDGLHQPKHFVRRPHAFVFMDYMIKNFWVVVWSSARPDNVASMCRSLLRDQAMQSVVAVWDRSRFGLTPTDYNKRVQCYKRLTLLWEDPAVAASHPQYSTGGRWSQANTVLIDDSPEKARSEPYNSITVPEFVNQPGLYDNILPRVHDYLNELCFQSDVSAFMRANPFTLITDTDGVEEPADSLASLYAKKQKKREKAAARKEARNQPDQTAN
ncbi:hypothetical protein SCUCBS95973_000054 [Sporothrix curviconia]|uniref:Mitochondrial import inner membrane translocase subunit TIM50 n=1 Tax=Sporothrix curviconia TaxID=1260050 RepID=A0ABP0ALX2_9PEZI